MALRSNMLLLALVGGKLEQLSAGQNLEVAAFDTSDLAQASSGAASPNIMSGGGAASRVCGPVRKYKTTTSELRERLLRD